jgi:hypothetical protein
MPDDTPLTLPPKAAAARIGIGRTKLLALIGAGRIEAVMLDGRIRVSVLSCDKFLASLPKVGTKADVPTVEVTP